MIPSRSTSTGTASPIPRRRGARLREPMQYRRILVPLAGASVDADVIRVAATLAKAHHAEILAVHVIEVRWNLALDAVLEAETERGEILLEEATKIAAQAGAKIETEL